MRVFAFIMAVYLLGLSLVPCADRPALSGANEQAWVQAAAHQDASHRDVCQPLCSCACCGTHTTVASYLFPLLPELTGHTQFLIRDMSFLSYDRAGIWQPPKLS